MDTKRELLISKGWIQAVALVGLCGFLLLGILAYRTYTDEPPIPSKVIGANGQLLFAGEDVSAGQEVFLKNGLMEYGSIFGHGAYLGPDFTADYLHRAALIANDLNAVCSCLCCFWQFGRRICGNSRMDPARMVLVSRSGL